MPLPFKLGDETPKVIKDLMALIYKAEKETVIKDGYLYQVGRSLETKHKGKDMWCIWTARSTPFDKGACHTFSVYRERFYKGYSNAMKALKRIREAK